MEKKLEHYSNQEIYEANCRIAAYNKAVHKFREDLLILMNKNKRRENGHFVFKKRTETEEKDTPKVDVDRLLLDDDTKFQHHYRLTPYLFAKVLELVKDELSGIPTNFIQKPVSARQKLCITLRYLATGESYSSLAFQYKAHKSTMSATVRKVLHAIVKHCLHIAMPKPTNESLKQNILDFYNKWNYPNCFGAIDGKHIKLIFPLNQIHSKVLLAIVDANCKYIAIDVGSYGEEDDTGIYLKSEMGKSISNGKFIIPPPTKLPYSDIVMPNVILGDDAFPLQINLMKPYTKQQSLNDPGKTTYNYRHLQAQKSTENAFGIMTSYFHIFHTPINGNEDTIDHTILASCILHNMLRSEKINSPCEIAFGNMDNVSTVHNLIPLASVIGRPNLDALNIRDYFKNYFNETEAELCQEDYIASS